MSARASRSLAVLEIAEGRASPDDTYAVMPLSEWRLALDVTLPGHTAP